METISEFMQKDHDRLDDIFRNYQRIENKSSDTAKKLFAEFSAGLNQHIAWEEDLLFPPFENKTGMRTIGPTAVMRMEHKEIKETLTEIQAALSRNATSTKSLEEKLLLVLTDHNDKEERILYPWLDESISQNEKLEIFKQLK